MEPAKSLPNQQWPSGSHRCSFLSLGLDGKAVVAPTNRDLTSPHTSPNHPISAREGDRTLPHHHSSTRDQRQETPSLPALTQNGRQEVPRQLCSPPSGRRDGPWHQRSAIPSRPPAIPLFKRLTGTLGKQQKTRVLDASQARSSSPSRSPATLLTWALARASRDC